MSSKASHYSGSVAELARVRDSSDRADDKDDGYVVCILMVILGLYLFASVVLLRAAYRLRSPSPGTPPPSDWPLR